MIVAIPTCPECGLTGGHFSTCPRIATTHRIRVEFAGLQLHALLRRAAAAGHASPEDLQLLAALDRWSAGELV